MIDVAFHLVDLREQLVGGVLEQTTRRDHVDQAEAREDKVDWAGSRRLEQIARQHVEEERHGQCRDDAKDGVLTPSRDESSPCRSDRK